MTNDTNTPRPLTDVEKAKQAAALAASKGADQPKPGNVAPVTVEHKVPTPQVAAIPGTAPLGVKPDTAKPATPTVAPAPQKPISEAPDAVSKAIDTLVKAAETVPANALVEGRKPAVLPDLTKPSTTGDAEHKAAIDRANANAGKAKGKGKTAPTVTTAKPVKLTPRETAAANPAFVRGYDFSKWPVDLVAIKPTAVIIDGVRATGVLKTLQTKTELALCVYAMPNAQRFNVYDVAVALQYVCGGSVDHKMNTVNQKAVPSGMWLRINPAARAVGLRDGKMAIAYGVAPSPAGLKKIRAALGDKTPKHWLPETAPTKAADKGKVAPASGTPATA